MAICHLPLFVGVIGNAALAQGDVNYDIIDDAQLTPEQVADLALDLVDNDLLAGMETLDLSIVGELRLDSVDHIAADIADLTGGFIWTIGKGLLGDIGDLNFNNIKDKKRADGDLNFIYSLLQFIADNASILSKVAYGIGTNNGISLGLVGSFLKLPADITDLLGDLPGFLTKTVYDLLIYGSYGYPSDSEELGGSLPAEVDTLDEIVQRAIGGLLAYPQDYTWEGEGDDAVKVWDESSVIMPSIAAYGIDAIIDPAYVNLQSKSIFQLLDIVAPFAINDLGVPALNNNLKKALMEAVEVEFNEIDAETLPAEIKTAFEVDEEDGTESYCNYIAYDKIQKSGKTWYYTTIERETEMLNGEPVLDEEGNEQTVRVRKYFKANTAAANEFFDVINWDWNIKLDSDPLSAGAVFDEGGNPVVDQIDLGGLVAEYGSIAGSLNHIIGIVFEAALTEEIKADFANVTDTDGWYFGTNEENLMFNIENVLKYVLSNFGVRIFGSDSPYAHISYESIADKTILEIVAMIGPSFFEDVMPQLIIPTNADGSYAFHDGVQVLEFGAIVFREFISEISPTTNYDAEIFANGADVSTGRQFAEHDAETWFNIILNMGMDIAYTYLNNITNFNTATPTKAITEKRWKDMLNDAIIWAANFVGEGSASVLFGFDPTSLNNYSDPLDKLSYILNTLLPLGFVNGCTTSNFDFDASILLDRAKSLLTEFDLCQLIGLFGRNTASSYNLMNSTNVIKQVLDLVNRILKLVFNVNILPTSATTNLNTLVTQANLKTIVNTLLTALNNIKTTLLPNALPVVAMFIKDWGGEQDMGTPKISLGNTIVTENGALTGTVDNDGSFTITNGSTGVWRHYKDASGGDHQDNQYVYTIKSVSAYNFNGTASSYVSGIVNGTTELDYGQKSNVTFNVANLPSPGAIVKFVVKYTVKDEDGNVMANGTEFETSTYSWLSYTKSDERQTLTENSTELNHPGIYTPHYVGMDSLADTLPGLPTGRIKRDYKLFAQNQSSGIKASPATVDGITFGSFSITLGNTDFSSTDVRNFDNYSQSVTGNSTLGGEKTATINMSGAAFNQATWDNANKTPGSKTDFSTVISNSKTSDKTATLTLIYYDDLALADLTSLVADEVGEMREADEYHQSGNFYAEEVLEYTEDASTEEKEKVTNFNTTGIDPDGDPDKEVTVINAATAWSNYTAALQNAIRAAYQVWNGASTFDHAAIYEALRLAANDVQYIKKAASEMEGASLDADVLALADQLNAVEAQYSDGKDYTDYKMYRWNRYNDVREDARAIVDAYRNALPNVAYDEYFPYASWINEGDLRTMVAGDPEEIYILALLEEYDEEEYEIKEKELKDAKNHYAGYTALDVAQAKNLLNRIPGRLLARDGGVNTTYLATEINAAKNQIGETNNNVYTARSWTKYINAYNEAKAVLANPTQMTAFDAKYELLTARNELVKVADEADYSELEALIAQAQNALANKGLYDNVEKDFGKVLAELGYHTFTNIDGDEVDLFSGSALYYNAEPYAKDEQEVIDGVARELKEALAKLKFKGIDVTGATVTEETLVEADEEAGIEAQTAPCTYIDALLDAAAVKNQIGITGATVTAKVVSGDDDYSALKDLEGYVGTNSTITLFADVNGVKTPVKTIKLIVRADVNGDGVVDVLDAVATELASTEHAELQGCYYLAANLATAEKAINGADLTEVVNAVLSA